MMIRKLRAADLAGGFVEALSGLAPVDAGPRELRRALRLRRRQGALTFVALDGGRGVGERLVRHAVEQARRLGCYKVILNCKDELAGFYGQSGFRPHSRGMRLDLPAATPALAPTAPP